MTPASRPRRGASALLALLSTLATLLAVEAFLRVSGGAVLGVPDRMGAVRMVGEIYPGMHDAELGYVPRPGVSDRNVWGTRVVITEDRLRSNGAQTPPSGEPVLAVGDSFTFGDEVNDPETWPAQLEAKIGRPVLNGGVFGYGLDQIVLRAERLLDRTGALTLVVAFTPDDVRRCEYAYRYAWKPWFEVVDGALAIRGVPVPEPGTPPPGEPLWRRALRWSFLGDAVMRRLDPADWLIPDSLRVHRQGVSVARLLIDRLADAAQTRGLLLLLVVQWHPFADAAPAPPLVRHALERGIPVLATEALLRRRIAAHERGAEGLFKVLTDDERVRGFGHLTPEGNGVVARAIARRLRALEHASGAARADGVPPPGDAP